MSTRRPLTGEVTVAHRLTGLLAGASEAQTEHDVVETALEQRHEVATGNTGHAQSALVVTAELLLEHAVDELSLLLLAQLQCRTQIPCDGAWAGG